MPTVSQPTPAAPADVAPAADTLFPRRLLDLRKARGWSQPELAAKIDTSGTIIGRYERGLITPSIDVARKLADVFSVTVDYLIGGGGPANALQDKVTIARWDALGKLQRDDRERITFVLDSLIREAHTRQAFRDSKPPEG
jgi:transcriptional regulator with XRE-family HTH domain